MRRKVQAGSLKVLAHLPASPLPAPAYRSGRGRGEGRLRTSCRKAVAEMPEALRLWLSDGYLPGSSEFEVKTQERDETKSGGGRKRSRASQHRLNFLVDIFAQLAYCFHRLGQAGLAR